jgi:ketosteroid isomerase-like protein
MFRRAAGVLAVAVCACRSARRPDATEARHAIDSLNAKIVAWYAAGQADSAAQVFAQDVWNFPPNSPPLVGRDSIRAMQKVLFAMGKWQFDLKTDDVVAADSIAVERGHYTLKVTAGPQARYPSFNDQGNYIARWRKESDGHWRQVWEAKASSAPPPGAAPPAGAKPSSTSAHRAATQRGLANDAHQ